MEPEPFIIMGILLGVLLTLTVQFVVRRRRNKKTSVLHDETEASQERRLMIGQQDKMLSAMMRLEERISVVERISTEKESTSARLSDEIESLR